MALDTITREEFDRRLDAANERREQELREIEAQQEKTNQLLTYFKDALDDIESELDKQDISDMSARHAMLLRKRLIELATKTAQVAESI